MFGSVERYSPAAGRRGAGSLVGRLLRILLITFVLYLVVSRFLASSYKVESVSMVPALHPADRVIVSVVSFGARVPFTEIWMPGTEVPARGDLVVVQPPFAGEPSLIARILEPLATFLTLQKLTLHRDLFGGRVNGYMVKRLVGMPGDTVRLAGFALSVKPRGGASFVPEQQIVPVRYEISTSQDARGWSSTFPFSGNTPEVTLRDDQYFVLGDNRTQSSDSRSWGPLTRDRIVGKVIYRYWPPASFGSP